MCGISGVLDPGGDREAREARVGRMSRALAHRGPDDSGVYFDERIAMGFRRLAVIDIETGQQPIRLEDDRAVIVLNGEIYNFRELRRSLEGRHRFRSKGDVEVVLRLYAEEGISCLNRLNGMFALAIWDRAARTLFLARDRCGVKPLFICQDGDTLGFASEFGALLTGGFATDRSVNRAELRHYLFQKYLSPGGSILRGIRSLPPGTVLEVGPHGERQYRYWEVPAEPDTSISEAEALERLGTLLRLAVRRQLVADVPVGLFLSGGLDSGTLTDLVRAEGRGAVRTFSVGFEGSGVVSELPQAARLARALGTEHTELLLDPATVAGDLDRIAGRLDGPLGDATAIPTWYVSRLAREKVTVALSGEGADEIFGGYPRQTLDVRIDGLGGIGKGLLGIGLWLSGRPASSRLQRRLRMAPGLGRQLDWSRVFTGAAIDDLALEPLSTEAEMMELHSAFAARREKMARADRLNARLETDRELFLPGDLLPKVDRMSMSHSLEVRVPYLDDDLVQFMTSLPGRFKARWGKDKRLLRRLASGRLDGTLAGRRKQGFDVPIASWLRGPLRMALTDYLSEGTVRRRGWFRPSVVLNLLRQHLRGEVNHGEPLWLLLALEIWLQRVVDRKDRAA